jgi:hypothetical protein
MALATRSVDRFGLDLDGMNVGIVHSAKGGTPSADVVTEQPGADGIMHKHIAGVKYEDITVICGTGMSKGFFEWLADTFDRKPSLKDGAIVRADTNLVERERLSFYHGLVSEIGFPALDGASKDAAYLTVKILPEYTRRVVGQKGKLTGSGLKAQKQWLLSNFRLKIDGLDCTRVTKIDAITLRQAVAGSPVGEVRDLQNEPGHLELPNLVVTLPEGYAESFYEWLEDFVIKGNSGPGAEKHGTLEYLSSNLQDVYFTLTFRNLGIFKLTRLPSGEDAVGSVRAEMYCEEISFQAGSLQEP